MQNPYEILGVKEGASQEEIKAAYREQVKKYHPDRHQDNPLYELAEEKLQEINEAYEYLTKNGGQSGFNGQPGFGGQQKNQGFGQNQNSEFVEIRRMIDRGNIPGAESMLSRSRTRNAEWFFLNGMISLKKGWYDNAVENINTAVSMDPSNMEYRTAMNSIMSSGNGYRTSAFGRGYSNNNDELCRMMQCYCCADALCDCI